METLYSVGIDAAKGKSTVCIMNQTGEVVLAPKDFKHNKTELDSLVKIIKERCGSENVKVVMEATGVYHLPIYWFLRKENFFVSVINPLRMKNYFKDNDFRNVKTDKKDALQISCYGSEKYYKLQETDLLEDKRADLQKLSRAYLAYQKPRVQLKQNLDLEIEKAMPGIKSILKDDKLLDFFEEFWHFYNISALTEKRFLSRFAKWAEKKNHRFHKDTPAKIYALAKEEIPVAPCNEITKLTVKIAVETVREIEHGLEEIIAQATEIAMQFPEYDLVSEMNGVGERLTPLIIAEIGDARRIHSKEALVSMCGIDVPPYESGQYASTKRKITKKGNRALRRHLYVAMECMIKNKPETDNAVYLFMMKKKDEHKLPKQIKVAGMRKFLHIYYARVKELYKELGIWELSTE